jgi:hypothetical protein
VLGWERELEGGDEESRDRERGEDRSSGIPHRLEQGAYLTVGLGSKDWSAGSTLDSRESWKADG